VFVLLLLLLLLLLLACQLAQNSPQPFLQGSTSSSSGNKRAKKTPAKRLLVALQLVWCCGKVATSLVDMLPGSWRSPPLLLACTEQKNLMLRSSHCLLLVPWCNAATQEKHMATHYTSQDIGNQAAYCATCSLQLN
jgi:hypothetical protein